MPIPPVPVDMFVEEEGEVVTHWTGMRCFCHGSDGQPDPNCLVHEPGGYLYREPHEIVGLITDISQRKELMALGVFMPGDCVFSPLTTDTVSEGDKIVFSWPLPHGNGDPIVRGDSTADTLTYSAVSSLYVGDEWGVKFHEGTDFRLVDRQIQWEWAGKPAGGTQPAEGTRYVAKYLGYLEWIAFVPPVTRISHGEDIGAKVILRKKHLL